MIKYSSELRKISADMTTADQASSNQDKDIVRQRSVPNIAMFDKGLSMLGVGKDRIKYIPGLNVLGFQIMPDKLRVMGRPKTDWENFSNPTRSSDIAKAVNRQFEFIQRRRAARLGERYDADKFFGADLRQYAGNGLSFLNKPVISVLYKLFGKLGLSSKPKGYVDYKFDPVSLELLGDNVLAYSDHNNFPGIWSGAIKSYKHTTPNEAAATIGHEGTPSLGHVGAGSTLATSAGSILNNEPEERRSFVYNYDDYITGANGAKYLRTDSLHLPQNTNNNYYMSAVEQLGLLNRFKAELNRSATKHGLPQVTHSFGDKVWDTRLNSDGSRNLVPALVEAGYLHRDKDGYFNPLYLDDEPSKSAIPYFGGSLKQSELNAFSQIINRMVYLESVLGGGDKTGFTPEQLDAAKAEYEGLKSFFQNEYPIARTDGRFKTSTKRLRPWYNSTYPGTDMVIG